MEKGSKTHSFKGKMNWKRTQSRINSGVVVLKEYTLIWKKENVTEM